jgi:hypothetical protein
MMQKILKNVTSLGLAAGLLLLASTASAQREAIDLSARGPQVGESVPEFSLPDQNGKVWNQDSILGPNGMMLVFVRSADW